MVEADKLNKKNVEEIQSLMADLKGYCDAVEEGADNYHAAENKEERDDAREDIVSALDDIWHGVHALNDFTSKIA